MILKATDFPDREKAFGAGNFLGSISSLIIYVVYAYFFDCIIKKE